MVFFRGLWVAGLIAHDLILHCQVGCPGNTVSLQFRTDRRCWEHCIIAVSSKEAVLESQYHRSLVQIVILESQYHCNLVQRGGPGITVPFQSYSKGRSWRQSITAISPRKSWKHNIVTISFNDVFLETQYHCNLVQRRFPGNIA